MLICYSIVFGPPSEIENSIRGAHFVHIKWLQRNIPGISIKLYHLTQFRAFGIFATAVLFEFYSKLHQRTNEEKSLLYHLRRSFDQWTYTAIGQQHFPTIADFLRNVYEGRNALLRPKPLPAGHLMLLHELNDVSGWDTKNALEREWQKMGGRIDPDDSGN